MSDTDAATTHRHGNHHGSGSGDHGHQSGGHGHHHGRASLGDFDWNAAAEMIDVEARAFGPYPVEALGPLGLSPAQVLDVGSGTGWAAVEFARMWPNAEVIAVDGARALLDHAERSARDAGLALTTIEAQFPEDLSTLPEADLIWSAQAVHHVGDQLDALRRLALRVRPGGTIAIVEGGLSPRWLPRDIGIGRPGLQARLDTAVSDGFENMRADLPGTIRTVEDWPALLRQAGLVDTRTSNVLIDRPATDDVRAWLRHRLERTRAGMTDTLDADDLATLDRLIDPTDPEGIDLRSDLFLLAVKSVHIGRRPAGEDG